MSIKKLLLASLFFLSLLMAKGQQIEIRPSIGTGTYSMQGLKDLMQQSVAEFPFDLKTTRNFPASAFYQLDIVFYSENNLGWGFTSGFYDTGARNYYTDYSGTYTEDLKVNSMNLGILVSQKVLLGHEWQGYFELATGLKFNKIKLMAELKAEDQTRSEGEEARGNGWWTTPQLRIGRRVYKNLALSVFAGYEFMLIKNLESENGGYTTPDIDWSGLRAGVSLSFIKK